MQPRYALRFENGERRGETIPITGSGITVGRKPGNSVQILDASVSGRHAELVVEPSGVLLRDLGSTNGTRVGTERVSEHRLAHADTVLFGNVRLTFLDTDVGDVPPAVESPAATPAVESAGDAVRTVSADKVARSRKSSLVTGAVLLVAIAAAAGGWFWMRQGASEGNAASLRPVEPVDGNLLAAGYSFEGDASTWEADEAAPAAFGVEGSARRSGENGLAVALEAGQWALSRSASVRVAGTRALKCAGWARREGGAQALLGLEFTQASGGHGPTLVWSPPAAADDFESLELTSSVPAGYDAARVVLLARTTGQAGEVEIDDVGLVASSDAPAPLQLDEYQLFALGSPTTGAVLHKIDRALLSGLAVRQGSGLHAPVVPLAASARENGMAIVCSGSGERTLELRIESALADLGLASTGSGGYRRHNVEFAREDVATLLCGAGKDLVNLRFDPPVDVRGRPESGGFQVEVALGATTGFELQLAFRAERDQAQGLARTARTAEGEQRLGEALRTWAQLRDSFPFEAALLAEADTSSGRLLEQGSNETRALRQEVERARFFRLVDLFRACKAKAERLAARYAGSEVERDALALRDQIVADVAGLEAELDRTEVGRLQGIARALEAGQSPKLAARVREYLEQRYAQAGER